MILRALGCSGSVLPGEHHVSFLVGSTLVVDMGSAASLLTLEEQHQVTDILLTHAHLDHTKDLGFFAENVFAGTTTPIRVRGTVETIDRVRQYLLNDEIWPKFDRLPTPENPILAYEPLAVGAPVDLDGVRVRALPAKHTPGAVGFLLSTETGDLLLSGDTGPTDELWQGVADTADRLRAILVEVSFPDRLEALAHLSGHLTPGLLRTELAKLPETDIPILAYHVKGPTREETIRDLEAMEIPRLGVLESGDEIEF